MILTERALYHFKKNKLRYIKIGLTTNLVNLCDIFREEKRSVLEREVKEVDTRYRRVKVKISRLNERIDES